MSADPSSDRTEHAEWRDLVDSPAWARLVQHAREEWLGPAFAARVEALADRPDDAAALSQLRQMLAAKKAVERILKVPEEALARLERGQVSAEPWPTRRGPL
jgi:hypothetical protein